MAYDRPHTSVHNLTIDETPLTPEARVRQQALRLLLRGSVQEYLALVIRKAALLNTKRVELPH